ncbi:hypothetical protein Nepgr_019550 [Nepenthes gracilis]|uniref:DPH4 homolog n=1 Tax=Nepenthes gracilis TaxID=150966 RepID=A0AAD3SVG7_NEPGR|nr:hypothetical protein Nepgr_019550 [Nepenthes gracilis]
MIIHKMSIQETHYDILAVKEDSSYEEIRANYRSALLICHPDKLHNTVNLPRSGDESGERFMKVQKAWEILSNSSSRAFYDMELQFLRSVVADDVRLEDMLAEDTGGISELYYRCSCGDYFSIKGYELEEMGCQLSNFGDEISVLTPDAIPGSIILSCGSCSLKIRLLISIDSRVPVVDRTVKI